MIEKIGDRPAALLPADSPLLDALRAVDRHLGLRTDLRLGSTDANFRFRSAFRHCPWEQAAKVVARTPWLSGIQPRIVRPA